MELRKVMESGYHPEVLVAWLYRRTNVPFSIRLDAVSEVKRATLAQALHDPERAVMIAASKALLKLGDESPVPLLEAAAEKRRLLDGRGGRQGFGQKRTLRRGAVSLLVLDRGRNLDGRPRVLPDVAIRQCRWMRVSDRESSNDVSATRRARPSRLKRLSLVAGGRVAYPLRKPPRNGATHLVVERLRSMARIASLILGFPWCASPACSRPARVYFPNCPC